jgi:ribulose-5-phosphate 4-epimerase/fuculose-1-phosphate aldolase
MLVVLVFCLPVLCITLHLKEALLATRGLGPMSMTTRRHLNGVLAQRTGMPYESIEDDSLFTVISARSKQTGPTPDLQLG